MGAGAAIDGSVNQAGRRPASGSRIGTFRCTGPAAADPAPRAAVTAATAAAVRAAVCSPAPVGSVRSGTGRSRDHRTWSPKIPGWRVVWLAPMPRNSGGLSAVSSTMGTPPWSASRTAGRRFATAVPDVQITAAGKPVSSPMPRAVNPATRSSIRTCRRIRLCSSAAAAARASAWERDPGLSTT